MPFTNSHNKDIAVDVKKRTEIMEAVKARTGLFEGIDDEEYVFGRPPSFSKTEAMLRIEEGIRVTLESKGFPTINSVINYLGIGKRTWNDWKHDKPQGYAEIVERTMGFLEELEEQTALAGQMNHLLYMFRMKAIYGYSDQPQEQTLTVRHELRSVEEAQRKVLADIPDLIEVTDFE